jgi:hypothetical protein
VESIILPALWTGKTVIADPFCSPVSRDVARSLDLDR